MKPQIPWLRVFVEGVVIVGSILLAFGLQAWWEDRQEREAERVYLLQLREDLHRAEEQLARIAVQEEAAGQSVLMLMAAAQQTEPPPNDSLVVWLSAAGIFEQGIPTLSTAQGLLASDVLRSIEDQEVRGGLISLLDQLSQMDRRQLLYEEIFMQALFRLNRIVPALSRNMPRYVGFLGNEPDSVTRTTRLAGRISVDLRPLLRDPGFMAVVDEIWITHENLRFYVQGMLNQTRAFLAVLDRALTVT